ncbi:hypothetical protein Scep_022843 [Stephania cephalantha]|uniref:Berberine/berberine-like domain-containing protein n=1 Tax=Stephania cephalantha TaxID=152367 RepID=A0AAP0FJ53_9MAGN
MSEISESEIPYPHREGKSFFISYEVDWIKEGDSTKNIEWMRSLYKYMAPYVSKNPRGAYINYRDLDLGQNRIDGSASYEEAKVWGVKYFNGNFDRLVKVKSKVDPSNFFNNEQTIPTRPTMGAFSSACQLILTIMANASNTTTTSTGQASFQALFLGGTTELLEIMQENFSELGLKREDCIEMSWIQSVLFFAGLPTTNVSLNAFEANILLSNFKGASDYVKQPISKTGLQGIWRNIVQMSSTSILQLQAYGGRMSEISDTSIPFPHRAGNTYKILYLVNNDNNIEELRRLYKYMTPYVSKSPRAAYLNARDLDLGHNEMWTNYTPSYEEAKIWGSKYFKNNFDRLVKVKSRIDPDNFFRNEQSIPPSFT